ncbi:MAG TPA: hypothetical protein DGH68_04040 [Bacteroidetes bacterium]|jgi:hypothetical protein|nr:hypothetical protein [Bacteroidota bacterium]
MAWAADDLVAASGGDYSTLTAWEAGRQGTTPSGDGVRARVSGELTEPDVIYLSGWQSGYSSSCKIVITAATGQFTDGKTTTSGARINKRIVVYEQTNDIYLDVVGIQFHSDLNGIEFNSSAHGGVVSIARCFFRNNYVQVNCGCAAFTVNVGGCVFYNATYEYGVGVYVYSSATVNVYNCTFDSMTFRGVLRLAGTCVVKNCVVINSGVDFDGCTETTNKSENDSTCTDDDADDFVAPSTLDYRVYNTSSALYHAGTAISDSWFTNLCATDIDGTSWYSTPSIGAFEYVASGGGGISAILSGSAGSSLQIVGSGYLSGASSGLGAMAAMLLGAAPMLSLIAGVATQSAVLSGRGSLATAPAGLGQITGNILGAGSLSGLSSGTGLLQGLINQPVADTLTATIGGISTVAGALGGGGSLAINISGSGSIDASAFALGRLTSTVAGVGATQASISGSGTIASAIAGIAETQGVLTGRGVLLGGLAGLGMMTGTMTFSSDTLIARIQGIGSLVGRLTRYGVGGEANTHAMPGYQRLGIRMISRRPIRKVGS